MARCTSAAAAARAGLQAPAAAAPRGGKAGRKNKSESCHFDRPNGGGAAGARSTLAMDSRGRGSPVISALALVLCRRCWPPRSWLECHLGINNDHLEDSLFFFSFFLSSLFSSLFSLSPEPRVGLSLTDDRGPGCSGTLRIPSCPCQQSTLGNFRRF